MTFHTGKNPPDAVDVAVAPPPTPEVIPLPLPDSTQTYPSHPRRRPARVWVWVLPPALWMLLILVASADTDSGARSSRWLEPFLRWLGPDLSAEERSQWIFWARKGVHVFAFGTLAGLFWKMWSAFHPGRTVRWRATLAWTCTVLYAVVDEVHQLFVPTRVGSPVDVAIDALGATLALGALVCYRRLRRTGAAK